MYEHSDRKQKSFSSIKKQLAGRAIIFLRLSIVFLILLSQDERLERSGTQNLFVWLAHNSKTDRQGGGVLYSVHLLIGVFSTRDLPLSLSAADKAYLPQLDSLCSTIRVCSGQGQPVLALLSSPCGPDRVRLCGSATAHNPFGATRWIKFPSWSFGHR